MGRLQKSICDAPKSNLLVRRLAQTVILYLLFNSLKVRARARQCARDALRAQTSRGSACQGVSMPLPPRVAQRGGAEPSSGQAWLCMCVCVGGGG